MMQRKINMPKSRKILPMTDELREAFEEWACDTSCGCIKAVDEKDLLEISRRYLLKRNAKSDERRMKRETLDPKFRK